MNSLVSVDWLLEHSDDADVKLLDGSWYMPAAERDGRLEFAQGHIPGAQFFDIDAVCDLESCLPHTLPSESQFAAAVSRLGISNADRVVVYDGAGMLSAPRVWWMFRAFGHEQVAVLDGGFPAWLRAGGEQTTSSAPPATAGTFHARLQPALLANLAEVQRLSAEGGSTIIDARSPGRFAGREPEPRPGIESGHMPGAINLPFNQCLDEASRTLLRPEALMRVFNDHGIPPDGDLVSSCGSGITACVLALALEQVGRQCRVYDGSWAEWASTDNPITQYE